MEKEFLRNVADFLNKFANKNEKKVLTFKEMLFAIGLTIPDIFKQFFFQNVLSLTPFLFWPKILSFTRF
jgi:hypothetical protein